MCAGRTNAARREILREIEPEDLLKFGLIPEFIGRLPVLATLGDLSETALIEILTRPKNALAKQYQRMFEMEGVKLRFQEEALHSISKRAIQRRTGARGLRSILEGILLETMFELPTLNGVQGSGDHGRCGRWQGTPALHLFGQGPAARADRLLSHTPARFRKSAAFKPFLCAAGNFGAAAFMPS